MTDSDIEKVPAAPQPNVKQNAEQSTGKNGAPGTAEERVSLLVEVRRNGGHQEEMPFAYVDGEAVTDLPKDL